MKPQPQWTTNGTCTRVLDGDTIEVEVTRKLRVRLLDCWAPELPTVEGELSKANLEELIEGREVTVQIPTEDDGDVKDVFTFGRVLGRVWLAEPLTPNHYTGHFSINDIQVQMKHATKEK